MVYKAKNRTLVYVDLKYTLYKKLKLIPKDSTTLQVYTYFTNH